MLPTPTFYNSQSNIELSGILSTVLDCSFWIDNSGNVCNTCKQREQKFTEREECNCEIKTIFMLPFFHKTYSNHLFLILFLIDYIFSILNCHLQTINLFAIETNGDKQRNKKMNILLLINLVYYFKNTLLFFF